MASPLENIQAHKKRLNKAMGKKARPKTITESKKVIKKLEGMIKKEKLKMKLRRGLGKVAKKVQSKLK